MPRLQTLTGLLLVLTCLQLLIVFLYITSRRIQKVVGIYIPLTNFYPEYIPLTFYPSCFACIANSSLKKEAALQGLLIFSPTSPILQIPLVGDWRCELVDNSVQLGH